MLKMNHQSQHQFLKRKKRPLKKKNRLPKRKLKLLKWKLILKRRNKISRQRRQLMLQLRKKRMKNKKSMSLKFSRVPEWNMSKKKNSRLKQVFLPLPLK